MRRLVMMSYVARVFLTSFLSSSAASSSDKPLFLPHTATVLASSWIGDRLREGGSVEAATDPLSIERLVESYLQPGQEAQTRSTKTAGFAKNFPRLCQELRCHLLDLSTMATSRKSNTFCGAL